jgi:dihydrofolate synthase/folylpolyglutamate synthase
MCYSPPGFPTCGVIPLAETQPERILDRLNALYPKAIDLSLDRVVRLLAELGDPQERLPPVVHVAGTNGKGSTVAYLRAIAEAAGRRAHVYISPHLVRFNERIRLAGRLIEDDRLAALLAEVERVNAGRPITFFEVTTAVAFLAFARTPADLVILETGLGGRLDATNVVRRPAVCAISPISFDHPDFLGDTVAKIAGEKAGILKPGVPAVIAHQPADAAEVLERRAAVVGAPLRRAGQEWDFTLTAEGFAYRGREPRDMPPPALAGHHQFGNAALAIAAAEELTDFAFTSAQMRQGLLDVEWPARLQRLTHGPLARMLPAGIELRLDGGHNESGGAALAEWARATAGQGSLDIVIAMRSTKAADRFLGHLAPYVRRLRSLSFEEPAWLSAEAIVGFAKAAGIADAAVAADAGAAVAELLSHPDRPGRILLCGSLYFAGKILAENG